MRGRGSESRRRERKGGVLDALSAICLQLDTRLLTIHQIQILQSKARSLLLACPLYFWFFLEEFVGGLEAPTPTLLA